MTLQSSGAISLANVNVELGRTSTSPISLGESAVRNLAGVASGAISLSNLYGKSSVSVSISPTSQSAQGTSSSWGFAACNISVSGGTASSYTWGFLNASLGTFSISAGQGSSSAYPAVSNVYQFDTATADVYCDVVVNGNTYRVLCSLSYWNGGNGEVLA